MGRTRSSTTVPIAAAALALLLAACSSAEATAARPHPAATTEDCFLGLDLWDTDPALTWIAHDRVWVRAGDSEACLTTTAASEIWWSPDGRRLFLDDQLVDGASVFNSADIVAARRVAWQQPLGRSLFTIDDHGRVHQVDALAGHPASVIIPGEVALTASHPDAIHLATVDTSGSVRITSLDTGETAAVMRLEPAEAPVQMEFAADGSRLWILTDDDGRSATARYVDLVAISSFLDIPEVESMVPSSVPEQPQPDLYFLDTDLGPDTPALATGTGASGADAAGFVLHPSHPDWIVLTEGSCAAATSSLFIGGVLKADQIPGAAVGFFRGHGIPVLATFSGGGDCGAGQLWETTGLPLQNEPVLVASDVLSADIRDEAPDPWNPHTAPPFA